MKGKIESNFGGCVAMCAKLRVRSISYNAVCVMTARYGCKAASPLIVQVAAMRISKALLGVRAWDHQRNSDINVY